MVQAGACGGRHAARVLLRSCGEGRTGDQGQGTGRDGGDREEDHQLMANIQQLIFDIIARDSASPAFAKLGATAQGAAGNVSDLSKRIDELGRRSAEARVGLAGDKEAQARLDKLDASLLTLTHRSANPNISIEGAARAAAEISALELQLDKLGSKSAPGATSALSGLAGTGGMGALIAAGVALSPVIIPLCTGLAGLAGGIGRASWRERGEISGVAV